MCSYRNDVIKTLKTYFICFASLDDRKGIEV